MNKIEFEDSDFFFYLPETWHVLPEMEESKDNLIRISSLNNEAGAATIHLVAQVDPEASIDLVKIMEDTLSDNKITAEIKQINQNTIFCEYLVDEGDGPLWMKRWLMIRKYYLIDALYSCYLTSIEKETEVLEKIMSSICISPSEIN